MAENSLEEDAQIYALRREDAKRAHDAEREFQYQTNQAAFDTGSLAIRAAFLINGGAAVAMLGFIGGMVAQGRIGDADLHGLALTLMWFAAGVVLASGSTAAAYFVNFFTAEMSRSRPRIWDHPYLGEPAKSWKTLRVLFICIAVVAGAASLGSFVVGMYKVKAAVEGITLVNPTSQSVK